MPAHLFITCSPLQLRIASAIRSQCENNGFHVIYLETKAKMRAGVKEELKNNFDSYVIAKMDYGFINLIRINNYIKKINADRIRIYLANAGELPIHYIVSLIQDNKKEINTFDDGISNINSIPNIESLDKRIKEKRKLRYKVSRLFFKKNYNTQKIINESALHFSILKVNKNKNITSKIINLDLFENKVSPQKTINISQNSDTLINIFIGSRFKDILKNKSDKNLNLLMDKVSYLSEIYPNLIYLRHPRETTSTPSKIKELKIDSISEDYILNLISQHKKINVIGFASTCQLNVMNLENITVTLLKTNLIRDDIINSFDLFNNNNVSIKCID
ncbi:TPA: glycosyltransferase family 52 [Providencia alcalifaciens]